MTYDNRLGRRSVLGGVAAAGLLAACKPSAKKYDAEIIVLGAGLSGLYAAHLLAGEGKDVLVLEGSDRIGGRMQTIYHNGHYTEGGGEQIGASYARIIDRARELGVELAEAKNGPRGTAYYYDDKLYGAEDWSGFESHPLPAPFKGGSPGRALFGLAGRSNPLQSAGDWRNPAHSGRDISAAEFLRQSGLDKDGLAYIDRALNANALETYSIMNVYRSLYLYSQSSGMGPSVYVKGGVQKLMDAMGAAQTVKLGQMISQIEVKPGGVSIETQSGKRYQAKHCICSLPFGALRNISVKAPVSEIQQTAINTLPYTQILQIHFEVEHPYWEKDGLPADMWTDGPVERIFANRNLDGELTGLGRMWINGTGATEINGKSDEDITSLAQDWMAQLRPESGRINVYKIQRWTKSNPLAGGAYMHWAPGQIGKWAGTMEQSADRLHFCGEHLSFLHTGMEGAMESAEQAAFHLLGI